MKEAKQAENEVVGRIERELVPILEEGEHSSARSMIERCVRAIRAAAVHAVGRPLLENGHLTVDFDSPGFEALGASMEAVPDLRLVTSAVEEKKRAKEDRLEQMRNDRIEAQAKIAADLQRVKQTMIDGDRAPKKKKPDPQRVKQTMFDEPVELPDLQRAKETISEANPLPRDPERAKQTMIDLEHRKQKAQLGDATKRLAALRLECAKLEEELGQKKSQIANLEKLLGMFDEEEE